MFFATLVMEVRNFVSYTIMCLFDYREINVQINLALEPIIYSTGIPGSGTNSIFASI